MERTMISKTGLWAGVVLLASLALAGCSKDPAGVTVDPGRKGTILSIAEVNYAVSGGGSKSAESAQGGDRTGTASGDDTPQTRAIVDGGGSTFFTDRDRLGLFLRGDGYEDVDNRIVQLDYPGEGPQKKWNITGEDITLYSNEATVTAYFPYSDAFGLTMSAIPLNPGPYDVNTNDLVWQRDKVHSTHTQAMFLEMQHALTRVKIRLSSGKTVGSFSDRDGGVVCWINPDDPTDYRVIEMGQSGVLKWAANRNYILENGTEDQVLRQGAYVMTVAKQYSDNKTNGATGNFAEDFPAFSYCYEKTDGGVSKGTWYLPSYRELYDLRDGRDRIGAGIEANGGTAFTQDNCWSSTEGAGGNGVRAANASILGTYEGYNYKTNSTPDFVARCIRTGSDFGDYAGEGKLTGVRIADAEEVSVDDRVVYLDGTLDLTQATPAVTPGWPDALADMSEKTLTEEGVLYDLLLLPVDKINEGKLMLEVLLDGKVLTVPFPVDQIDRWEAGKAYTYEVSIRNGEAQVVFGRASVTPWNYGGSLSGSLDPSKPEYGGGDVQDWDENGWQTGGPTVGDVWGGGVVYWVNPADVADFRVVALDEATPLQWAASNSYVLGSGAQDLTARNGADIWKLAKDYSDNRTGGASGTFSTDFPAFNYCYEKTDGGVAKGTWYLPSKQELLDLYSAKGSVESVITDNSGTAFSANIFWSATEYSGDSRYVGYVSFNTGNTTDNGRKSYGSYVRCVRDRRVVSYELRGAAVTSASGAISGGGVTFGITLVGTLPPSGVEVRAQSGGTVLAEGKATQSGEVVELAVPASTTGAERTVSFEYLWDGVWTKFAERTQVNPVAVGYLYGGGVVYWVNPADVADYRVVALDEATPLQWAASNSYVLGSGAQDLTARNGADIWKLAKDYSDNRTGGASGTFSTDFPAFNYCYEKTDGGVAKGTWYLPSKQELLDLYSAKGSVESVITDNSGTAFSANIFWSATEYSGDSRYVGYVSFNTGNTTDNGRKSYGSYVRCIRSR